MIEPTDRSEFRQLLELAADHTLVAAIPPELNQFLDYAKATLHVSVTSWEFGRPERRTPPGRPDIPWPGRTRRTVGELHVGDILSLGRGYGGDSGQEVLAIRAWNSGVSLRTAAQPDIQYPCRESEVYVYDYPTPTYQPWQQLRLLHAGEVVLTRLRLMPPAVSVPAPPDDLPPDGYVYEREADVPAAFRDGDNLSGAVLTAPFLDRDSDYRLKTSYLTRNYGPGKALTRRVKIGRAFAYLYKEAALLVRNRDSNVDVVEAQILNKSRAGR